MILQNSFFRIAHRTLAISLCAICFNSALAADLGAKVDDFSDATKNSFGIVRHFVDDKTSGGQTQVQHEVKDGVLQARGEILPPRGQPGWASMVLLLDPKAAPQDASNYDGIRLVVRVHKGNLSVSANSSEVANFDYHAATVSRSVDGKFSEVKIPFSQMKRAWSEQTQLNTKSLIGLSLVAFDVKKSSFHFEVDEIGFY